MAKATFNNKRTLFTSTLDLELRKKLVKCYVWSIAVYGAETWTLRAVDQKHLESFEMWCWRKMEDVLVKLSVGLLWLKLHSTRRGLFLLAHWTWN